MQKLSAMSRIIDGVVSKSILEKAEKGAANVDWFCIPPEERIVDDSILSWVAGFEEAVSTDFFDCEKENSGLENPAKRLKTEASNTDVRKPLATANRFECVTTSDQLATFSEGFVPATTEANTEWAMRNFKAWADWRITQNPEDPVPSDILSSGDAVALNKWLSLYVIETRKQDGGRYPASTLNLLLCGLKRHMKKVNPATPNFLDENDDRFAGLRGTRDVVARKLREDGVGASVKHTATISQEEEAQLWSEGVLGLSSPRALLNAIFFLNGKTLCLRGGREHRALKLSQFTFGTDDGGDYVVYTENGSKNRSGSYKDKPDDNKVIKHYADSSLGEKCYYRVLKLYTSKLPPKTQEDPEAVFYWKPKEKVPLDATAAWFLIQPVGRNTLASMVKNMCSQIGVTGKTNHSLRATGATRLFEANVPEKLIQERTGHKSTDALRRYERTSVVQQKAVSSVICASNPTSFQTTVVNSVPDQPVSSELRSTDPFQSSGLSLFQNCNNCTINVAINHPSK